jgi:hypothetical protein
MTKMLELTQEQQRAYDRFIVARNRLKKNKTRHSEISHCIDVSGLNHPLYVVNDDYVEYQVAFAKWLEVEPTFRKTERMSAIRGDYGVADSWEEKPSKIKEIK